MHGTSLNYTNFKNCISKLFDNKHTFSFMFILLGQQSMNLGVMLSANTD